MDMKISIVSAIILWMSWAALGHMELFEAENEDHSMEERIIGGRTVDPPHSRPWQAYLFYPSGISCGGTVIGAKWVISAAHCILNVTGLKVAAGTNERCYRLSNGTIVNRFGEGVSIKTVKKIYTSNFTRDPVSSINTADIALLELSSAFPLNRYIKAIKWTDTEAKDGDTLELSGWGRTSLQAFRKVCKLRTVSVPKVSKQECESVFKKIDETQFCAGYKDGQKGACKGDSGGPLVKITQTSPLYDAVLFGLPSASQNCSTYDVYTNVAHYSQWIKNITKL